MNRPQEPADRTTDLGVEVPAELEREFLARVPYVAENITHAAFADPVRSKVRFRIDSNDPSAASLVARRLVDLAAELCRDYRPCEAQILASRALSSNAVQDDPHAPLQQSGELFQYGAGRFGFGPVLAGLMDALDGMILETCRGFTAQPYRFPSLVGADVLQTAGYLRGFPQLLGLVSHLREDLEVLRRFAASVSVKDGCLNCHADDLAGVRCLLSPTVCFHAYAMWANRVLDGNRTLTALGKCFRYESANMAGLERLWDFSMREVVFLGAPDWVQAQREAGLACCQALMDRLGLGYEIRNANDPFFLDGFGSQAAFQQSFALKFEILCPLPYRRRDLAVGSINYHMDRFGKSFAIWNDKSEPVHTACIGFGLERLALAVLAQHGTDAAAWPEPLRDAIAKGARRA